MDEDTGEDYSWSRTLYHYAYEINYIGIHPGNELHPGQTVTGNAYIPLSKPEWVEDANQDEYPTPHPDPPLPGTLCKVEPTGGAFHTLDNIVLLEDRVSTLEIENSRLKVEVSSLTSTVASLEERLGNLERARQP